MKSAVQYVMLEVGLSLLSCEYVASPVLCLGDILGYLFVHLFVVEGVCRFVKNHTTVMAD